MDGEGDKAIKMIAGNCEISMHKMDEATASDAAVVDSKPAPAPSPSPGSHNSIDALTVPYILNGELYQILSRNGENVTVKCCSCPSGRFYRGSVRSTGNFHMHIKRRHPYLLGKLHDMKVNSLLERRDRLMKNRKAKLRRILVNNGNGSRVDHEQHKLKIKRAFQRHQEEAKGNVCTENGSKQEEEVVSREQPSDLSQFQEISNETILKCNQNTINFPSESKKSPLQSPQLPTSTCSLLGSPTKNAFCELRILNVTQLNPIQNTTIPPQPPNQQSTPLVTPFSSNYENSNFNVYNPPTYSHIKGESYYVDSPLDLSRGGDRRSVSPIAQNSFDSSGIGMVEPMFSNTTVANTISTSISIGKHNAPNSSQSIDCNNDSAFWQQRLTSILRDVHNDLRARNRIEHNRLLLEIAKMKFLNPGFYFNLQD